MPDIEWRRHHGNRRAEGNPVLQILRQHRPPAESRPYAEDRARTLRLVDTGSAEDVFLEPPHYHGDPISGKILSYRIYGRDLIERLEEAGFDARFEKSELAAEGI